MTHFEQAVALTLDYEGEQSDHPQDPGGLTRYGISQRWHPKIDVAKLTRADAIVLLEQLYWFPLRGDLLPWPLAAAVFDHGVHSGVPTAAMSLQRAAGVGADGAIGPITRAAIEAIWARPDGARPFLDDVLLRRVRELAAEGKPVFMPGWMARVADLSFFCGYELRAGMRLAA